MRSKAIVLILIAAFAAISCDDAAGPGVPAPGNLIYELEPSGDPEAPQGILLRWDPVASSALQVYRVYSRPDDQTPYGIRGETTSISFHDSGIPDLEYFVVAVDLEGFESEPSNSIVVDERLRLERPDWLFSTSLNGAIHLAWSDNAFEAEPGAFKQYRVYSAAYSLDANLCDDAWSLEGTTVSPEFIAAALANGFPRCFGVSAESIEGYESLWSDIRADTPRPDARNVLIFPMTVDQAHAGFRFFQDVNGDGQVGALELGIIADGSRSDIDFRITSDGSGHFSIVPVRSGTTVRLYSAEPLEDLTSIDYAPESDYSTAAVGAVPRYGYVFEMSGGDAFARYGAIRVTHVGSDYMIFDWSYQTDPGNPELSVGGGIFLGGGDGITVKR